MLRKTRKQENIKFIVKWIVGDTMHFKAFKRDNAAVKFQEYLLEVCEVDCWDIRIIMK